MLLTGDQVRLSGITMVADDAADDILSADAAVARLAAAAKARHTVKSSLIEITSFNSSSAGSDSRCVQAR